LFSSLFDIMSQVVCGTHRSVHAAYQASAEDIGVSITSPFKVSQAGVAAARCLQRSGG
jgi:hypothetical protein